MNKLELALEKMNISLGGVSSDTADKLVSEAVTLIKEHIDENKPKKQPKKTPYTIETFPENALWFRLKSWDEGTSSLIIDRTAGGFYISFNTKFFNFNEIDEDIEIGCLTRNHKIEWRPFYIEE